jgi:hypothetical protein
VDGGVGQSASDSLFYCALPGPVSPRSM